MVTSVVQPHKRMNFVGGIYPVGRNFKGDKFIGRYVGRIIRRIGIDHGLFPFMGDNPDVFIVTGFHGRDFFVHGCDQTDIFLNDFT